MLLPDTITSWDITGFSLDADYGFGISTQQSINVMQFFFVELHIPYSDRVGEILKVDATVFSRLPYQVNSFNSDVTPYSETKAQEKQQIIDNQLVQRASSDNIDHQGY